MTIEESFCWLFGDPSFAFRVVFSCEGGLDQGEGGHSKPPAGARGPTCQAARHGWPEQASPPPRMVSSTPKPLPPGQIGICIYIDMSQYMYIYICMVV